jgi:hypothetical protein
MRTFLMAALLTLTPAMASAQSASQPATGTTVDTGSSPPSTRPPHPGGHVYGPPAPPPPSPEPTKTASADASKPTTASDSAPTKTKHRGHHRSGGYVGMDAGVAH